MLKKMMMSLSMLTFLGLGFAQFAMADFGSVDYSLPRIERVFYYFSDATYTTAIGLKHYDCQGGLSEYGDTSGSYIVKEFSSCY